MQECIVNVSSIDQRFKFRRETLKPIFFKVTKENTALGDAIQLLCVRVQQEENFAQEVNQRRESDVAHLRQRLESYAQVNAEAKEIVNRRIDLLDLRLQQVEETTRN